MAALLIGAATIVTRDAAAEQISGRSVVIDGDTIEIHGRRLRLAGIDAPESAQLCADSQGQRYRCGQRAAEALERKLRGKVVSCEFRAWDRYRRALATCRVADEDINGWLVREGHALAYRQFSPAYVPEEEMARAAKKGIWSGAFQLPWEFRDAWIRGTAGPEPARK